MAFLENLLDSLAEASNVPLPELTPEEERRLFNCSDEDMEMADKPYSGQERQANNERSRKEQGEARENGQRVEDKARMSRDEILRELRRMTSDL